MFSENFHRYRREYAVAIVCLIIMAGIAAYSAYLMKPIVDGVFVGKDASQAVWLAGIVAAIYVVKGVMAYLQAVVLNRVGNNIVARFQRRVYGHLLSLGVGFFSGQHSAYLVARINQNILLTRDLLNNVVLAGARDMLTLICMIGVMLVSDLVMSFFVLVVVPIALLTINTFTRRVKRIAREEVDLNARVTTGIQETAHGIAVVKAFTMEEQLMARLFDLTRLAEGRANKIARIAARSSPLMETLAGFSVAAVVAYGGFRVANEGYSAGALSAFMTALLMAYEPAKRLARLRIVLERSLVNARMIYEILDIPPADSLNDGKALDLKRGEIRFNNVTFKYQQTSFVSASADAEATPISPAPSVLDKLSFVAQAGKTTALVGPSGGGKSTIFALLQKFYKTADGTVTIDGQNVGDSSAHSVRANIAYVSQHPILFEGTVRENLRFARPNATDEEIEQAARSAQAHGFVTALPQGYDTPLGENGANLSGGQRQRLSIARAIVRNAPILLLDEATSALDNESEGLVQAALEELMKGRTTLVIAHRLSTVANADNIIVIEAGQAVDQGKHADLLKRKNGIYARLHASNGRPAKPKQATSRKRKTAV